jgi:hypothetical protein
MSIEGMLVLLMIRICGIRQSKQKNPQADAIVVKVRMARLVGIVVLAEALLGVIRGS